MDVESEQHAGKEVKDGQHPATEGGRPDDGIDSTKTSGIGTKVDKCKGTQEKKDAPRKEESRENLTRIVILLGGGGTG